ncbi:uncharacterized protein [Palaemon carinicauda]|uniref:uncharacterized protein n=1 Tax=Palaemon carinicauda TaxID=392227 RepID=UPI0035B57A34
MDTALKLGEEALLLTKEDIQQLTRDEIVNYLCVLDVSFSPKDSTVRLNSLLQGAIRNAKRTETDDGSMKHEDANTGSNDSMMIMLQMLQQQMKLQEDRILREQEHRDREQERRDCEQERRDRELTALLNRFGPTTPSGAEDNPGDPRRNIPAKISIRPPELLEDGVTLKSFKRWEASWKNYAQVAKLSEKPREDQIATFWSFCKPDFLQRVRHAVEIPLDTALSLNEIIEQIKKYLKDQRNVAVDRYKLVRRKQDAGESFDDFLVDLRERAEDANLADMTSDEWITTLIVSGVRDEETRQELLSKKPTLSLADTISLCRNHELAEREDKRLSTESAINAAGFKQRGRSRSTNRRIHHGSPKEERLKCRKCGFPPHQTGRLCPAVGKTCHYCGFSGHFSKVCEKQKKGKEAALSPKFGKLKHRAEISFRGQERPVLPIEFHHPKTGYLAKMNAIADTGAQMTVAGKGMLHSLRLQRKDLQNYEEHLVSVNGKRLRIIGGIDLLLKIGDMHCVENVIFCRDVKFDDMYLSLRACRNLGIVHEDFPLPAKKLVEAIDKSVTALGHSIKSTDRDIEVMEKQILQTYKEVFNIKGQLQTMKTPPMKIQLKEDAKPFAIYAARPVSYPLREAVKKELEDMMKQGIIERVGDRLTEWCHPIVVVPKPTGGIRMTVDLSKLNSQVHRIVHNAKIPHDVIN